MRFKKKNGIACTGFTYSVPLIGHKAVCFLVISRSLCRKLLTSVYTLDMSRVDEGMGRMDSHILAITADDHRPTQDELEPIDRRCRKMYDGRKPIMITIQASQGDLDAKDFQEDPVIMSKGAWTIFLLMVEDGQLTGAIPQCSEFMDSLRHNIGKMQEYFLQGAFGEDWRKNILAIVSERDNWVRRN